MNQFYGPIFPGKSAVLKTYAASFEGYIESVIDRFRSNSETCDILEAFWEENRKHFPSSISN